jgi:hypothetical protein
VNTEAPTVAAVPLTPAEGPVPREERRWLNRLTLLAFSLRVVIALVLHVTGGSAQLAPDEITYASNGRAIALYWAGDLIIRPARLETGEPLGYFYINALFVYLLGSPAVAVVAVKVLNCAVGAFACRVFFWMARELFGSEAARRTASLVAWFPSFVLWSAVNIRDIWVLTIIAYSALHSLRLMRRATLRSLVAVAAATGALTAFRDYLFIVVAAPPFLVLVAGRAQHLLRNFMVGLVLCAGLVLGLQTGVMSERAQKQFSIESIATMRQNMAHGAASAFEANVDVSTPGAIAVFLPLALAYFFFSPFPWQITSVLRALSVPEMLIIYSLTPAIVRGIRFAVTQRLRESLQVLGLMALLTVSYALGEGNVGTLYRHRAQAFGFYLMMGAVGLELRRSRRALSSAAALPPPGRAAGHA